MNINIFNTLQHAARTGSIMTNLALSGYLFFFNEMVYDWFFYDTVHEVSSEILYHGGTNPLLEIILILAMAGEFTAFILKSKYGGEFSSDGAGIFLLWMFHAVVSVIMTIIALGAFGITFQGEEVNWILAAALFGSVIKELFILMVVIAGTEKRKPSRVKNFTADILFLFFYSLAYTTIISNLLKPNDYNNYLLASHYSISLVILYTFIVILLFFMLYLPLRIPYFLYEKYESAKERILGALSILLVAATAILPLFEGEYSLEAALKDSRDVEILFLNSTGIEQVPEEVTKLTNLRALHLGFNRLSSLPPWIVKLERLEWIGLGGNSFRNFPPELLELPRLREIDIHYNRIKEMPRDLGPLKKLKSLNIRSNPLPLPEKNRVIRELQKSKENPDGISLTI